MANIMRVGGGGATQKFQFKLSSLGNNYDIGAVAYGDGRFVAVTKDLTSGSHNAFYSTDEGKTWNRAFLPTYDGYGYYSVCYGNGIWLASRYDGAMAVSIEGGESWKIYTNGTGTTFATSICYGNGIFVAVNTSGEIYTSTYGTSWTYRTTVSSDLATQKIFFINGEFVLVSKTTKATSTDVGTTWTTEASDCAVVINDVTYGNGMYVASGYIGSVNYVTTSTDAKTWTTPVALSYSGFVHIAYGSDLFALYPTASGITEFQYSRDAQTWQTGVKPSGSGRTQTSDESTLTFGNGSFVFVGSYDCPTYATIGETSAHGLSF